MWKFLYGAGVAVGGACFATGVALSDVTSIVIGAFCITTNTIGIFLELTDPR